MVLDDAGIEVVSNIHSPEKQAGKTLNDLAITQGIRLDGMP